MAALCVMAVLAGGANAAPADAQQILDATGVQGGLIVHVGCGDGKLTAALRASDSYVVHGLDADAANVAKARESLRKAGLYGKVTVDCLVGARLPHIDNLVNLVVSEDLGKVSMAEVMRVLAPNGVAYVKSGGTPGRRSLGEGGWAKTVKPRPADIDEWTHWLHGADGNAVADDRVVGPPRRAQWVAEPRWQRHHEMTPSVSAMVSSGGRVFAIINQALPGITGMPDRWALVARDAFNGTFLWQRPIAEWGPSQWNTHAQGHGRWNHPTNIAHRLVAAGDRVYVTLGFNAPLTALDAATGRTVKTYPQTEFTDEILHHEGTLVLSVSAAAQGPGRIKDKPAAKKSVMAVDAQTGKVLWRTDGLEGAVSKADMIERITHLTLVLGGGGVYCIEENAVVALDIRTGKEMWRMDRGTRKRTVTYGSYYMTNLNNMVYHDGVVLFMEPEPSAKRMPYNAPAKCTVLGLSAETGKKLWARDCGFWGHYGQGDIFVIDGLAWVHAASGFSAIALDPRSGEVKKRVSTKEALDQGHHHRCYRNKATTRYLITGRRGAEFIDLASGENTRHHWVRGTCRYGVMPANGLLYAPPHPCICYITAKLNGFWALAPSSAKATEGKPAAGPPLEKGPAYGATIRNPKSEIRNEDWPTYRHDVSRSGCATTMVSGGLTSAWQAELGGKLSSPVIAGGKVFVAAVDTHTVHALEESSGKIVWSYTAGGRVDTPPTVDEGLALFGSADGWVYCLRTADGKLVWRRRVAPDERRMMSREQLESPWPVHGSVLIRDGEAYVVAGRSSFLDGGMVVAVLDPRTGKLLRSRRIDSLDPKTGDMVPAQMYYDMPPSAPGALPDILLADGKNVYMRHLKFDPASLDYDAALGGPAVETPSPRKPATKKKPSAKKKPASDSTRRTKVNRPVVGNHLMSTAGLLDDSWFNQTFWTIDGKSQCKLLVFDDKSAYGVKPYAATARHARAAFHPGKGGYTLFANGRPKHTKRWTQKVPVRAVAMVLAGPTLFIAGSPDVVDSQDPWAAIDGKKGAVLWAVSAADGKKIAEYKLSAPPTYDGLAAANGKLYLTTRDGKVLCMSAK
jgi:outer membrane protein assembly factor BamB